MRRPEHIMRTHAKVHAILLKAHFGMSVQDILWMSYVHSIYVLCPGGYFTEAYFLEVLFLNSKDIKVVPSVQVQYNSWKILVINFNYSKISILQYKELINNLFLGILQIFVYFSGAPILRNKSEWLVLHF